MNAAIERLALSRDRLRRAMVPSPAVATAASPGPQRWWRRLTEWPAVSAVVESVEAWWSQHPLRPVVQVAGEATTAAVKPLAQRNPVALVLAAAAVGAALAWSRPWRWAFRSALFAGLVPQLVARVVAHLPIESWMTMLGSMLSQTPASFPSPGGDPVSSAS